MSKRPEDTESPEIEEGMTTAERRRRRRRGAGLRVPSDNVPRRSASHPVVAPVPEDPNLAVSIAYSFGNDASQPVPRPAAEPAFRDVEDDGAAGADEFAAPEEVPIRAITESGAVALPHDDGLPETAAATVARGMDRLAALEGGSDGRTREMPAMQLEALGLEVPEEMRGDAGETGDTVIVDLGEAEEPPRAAPAATGRAATVALSEDDLEELLEGGSGPHLAAKATALPTVTFLADREVPELTTDVTQRALSEPPVIADEAPAPATATPAATSISERSTDEVGAVAAPAAVAESEDIALDDDDLQDEVVAPADPSDSGEIISDELIEEVEAQSAAAVPLRVAAEDAVEPGAAAPTVAAGAAIPDAPPPAKPPPAPPAVAMPPPAPPKKATSARAAAAAAAARSDGAADGKDAKKRRAKPWFEEIFDEDYLRTLPFLTPQATQSEAQFVIDALSLQPGAQVLDLGCGYGRHAMELAARGFHVVGLDQSLPLLLRGADEAQRRGLTINFVHGDMRELDFDSQFDGAYCLFSTFGFFDDEANKKTASNLARALKPGARAVIDILNRDYLIADLPTRVWWEGDGCVVLEEVEFNYFSSRVQCNRSVVFDDGRQVEQEISVRAYSLHELGKLLHAAGFRVLEVSGSMVTRGRFFGGTSRQIVVIAERRAKDETTPVPKT